MPTSQQNKRVALEIIPCNSLLANDAEATIKKLADRRARGVIWSKGDVR